MRYLAKAPEVQVFLRPQGKIEENLKMLSKTNTDKVIQYYFKNVSLSGTNQKDGVFAKYTADINDFVKEQKILLGHLKNFKQYIGAIVPMKEQELKLYRQFSEFLNKYEEGETKTTVTLGD
jgi:hypothetical protein